MPSMDRIAIPVLIYLAAIISANLALSAPTNDHAATTTKETVVYIVPENEPFPETSRSLRYKTLEVTVTAYSQEDPGVDEITYTGHPVAIGVVAVDPNVIPLGSVVYVPGYGYAIALDKGGAIKGNKVDVYFTTRKEALEWGTKQLKIRIFNQE